MFGGVEMLGGMLIFGGIAAAHVAAEEAEAEMYPGIAHFQALFAAFAFWFDLFNLIEVRANVGHDFLLRD
jgi:hypothetical protein